MVLINPASPVHNTIIFYIIIMVAIILVRPSVMYSSKINKFKSFGCGDDQTLMSLPVVGLTSAIVLYFIFLMIEVLNNYMEK